MRAREIQIGETYRTSGAGQARVLARKGQIVTVELADATTSELRAGRIKERWADYESRIATWERGCEHASLLNDRFKQDKRRIRVSKPGATTLEAQVKGIYTTGCLEPFADAIMHVSVITAVGHDVPVPRSMMREQAPQELADLLLARAHDAKRRGVILHDLYHYQASWPSASYRDLVRVAADARDLDRLLGEAFHLRVKVAGFVPIATLGRAVNSDPFSPQNSPADVSVSEALEI